MQNQKALIVANIHIDWGRVVFKILRAGLWGGLTVHHWNYYGKLSIIAQEKIHYMFPSLDMKCNIWHREGTSVQATTYIFKIKVSTLDLKLNMLVNHLYH